MKEVIGIAKTRGLAEIEAMRTLGIGNDERITMEMLEMPVKGTFGIWGNRPAKLKLEIEVENPINKIDTSDIKSEKEKAIRLLGENFNESIICWAAIYAVKINKDIPTAMAIQTINALWEKLGIEKGYDFSEKLKAFILLIDEDRLADEMDIIKRFYAGEFRWESNLEHEAQLHNISIDKLIEIRKMEFENGKLKQKMHQEKINKLQELAKEVKKIYPYFDLELEIQNPLFEKLINAGVDMQRAFEVLNKKLLFQKKQQLGVVKSPSKTIDEYFDILTKSDEYFQQCKKELDYKESEEELVKRAAECEISVEILKDIKKLERENATAKLKEKIEIYTEQSNSAEKLQNTYQQFDINEELTNLTFKKLVSIGIDIYLVYELIHFQELYEPISSGENKESSSSSENKLFCRICGKELPLDSKFCLHCGTQVIK